MASKDAKGKKTIYPHVVMRSAAKWALIQAAEVEEGSFYQALLGSLATAFAVEAYLNFLGEKLLPHWNTTHEKKSPKQKLAVLAQAAGFHTQENQANYQAFTDVFSLRNALVHGKVQVITGSWKTSEKGKSAVTALKVPWEKLGDPKEAKKIHDRCLKLVNALHAASGVSGPAFGSSMHGLSSVVTP